MSTGGSPFSDLPSDLCEKVLVQAWEQLDQRHRFGIIPLVCRSWRQLSLRSSRTLDVGPASTASLQQLSAWIARHGPNLRHICFRWPDRTALQLQYADCRQLVDAVNSSATQLLSLHFNQWPPVQGLPPLSPLTTLTSLRRYWFFQDWQAMYVLTQLRTLDLSGCHLHFMYCDIPRLVTSLPQLTRLDLSYCWVTSSHLQGLSSHSGLQQLQLAGCNLKPGDLQAVAQLPCTSLGLQIRTGAAAEVVQARTYFSSAAARKLEHLDIQYGGLELSSGDLEGLLLPFSTAAAATIAAASAPAAVNDGRGAAAAAPAAKLSSLNLQGNLGFCQNLHILTGLHHLTKLDFTVGTMEERDVSQLTALSCLRELTISAHQRQFSLEEVNAAREVVTAMPHLTKFVLMGEDAGH